MKQKLYITAQIIESIKMKTNLRDCLVLGLLKNTRSPLLPASNKII